MFKPTTSICLLLAIVLSLVVMPAGAVAQPRNANVALGKTVTFACGGEIAADGNYGLNAVNGGLSVLTDGISRSANWWVNNGNPYIALKSSILAGPYTFTVDLGKTYETEQLSLYSYGRSDWGLYPADAIRYSASVDGNSWTDLGSITISNARLHVIDDPRYEGTTVDLYEFAMQVQTNARYIRATLNTNVTGLVGIGEIEVYGADAPEMISKGAAITYFGHGVEAGSDASWGDSAVRSGLSVLTDGVGNSPNWWVNSGNPNIGLKASVLPGPYVFNMDLGAQSILSRISSYFYSRTAWGGWMLPMR